MTGVIKEYLGIKKTDTNFNIESYNKERDQIFMWDYETCYNCRRYKKGKCQATSRTMDHNDSCEKWQEAE